MIICADDYGMRADIDRAILDLCSRGKLTAVSCMVLFERCTPESLQEIRKNEAKIDLGLHFCLTTESLALTEPPAGTQLGTFSRLFRRAVLRTLPKREIEILLRWQYDLFVTKAGRRPDYIDGHLHTHQLPVIADVLVQFVSQLPASERPYIRNTRLSTAELRRQGLPAAKAGLIGHFGRRLEQKLRVRGIPTNDGFSGIYDFKDWAKYAEFFPSFTACLPQPNGILVTHPGHDEDWRRAEWETLGRYPGGANRFQR